MKLNIVFEDDRLMVIDKPAGLVVTPADSHKKDSLSDILQKEYGINLDRGGVVHRLDKDTSGLLVVAKTQQDLENLQAQFKARTVKKEYLTLVHGLVEKGGEVKKAIDRNPYNREKFTVLSVGREAETGYIPVQNYQIPNTKYQVLFEDFNKIQLRKLEKMDYGKFSLLRCLPLTGRTHQIRVHLKYIGFPVVSDQKYSGRKIARLDRRWCPRQFLHAFKLQFDHPQTGKKLEFEIKLPEDLQQALDLLKVVA